MRLNWKSGVVGVALTGAVAGLASVGSAANARTTTAAHGTQQATATRDGDRPSSVAANEREVLAFLREVLNQHHGESAGRYMTQNVQWHGGTVGTITGRANVAGLFAGVVAALPDVQAVQDNIFGAGNEVVVRQVVTGTQEGAILGIPATDRKVRWDAIDIFQLTGGKISQIWAGDDWTAVLNDTGTYKAPWIP
jgi:predicted ester cyclase